MNQRYIALINEDNCIGCAICIEVCPFDAIIGAQNYSHRINYNECPGCKICINKCPTDCISITKINQNKNDIKKKVKFNFERKKTRVDNLLKKHSLNISKQLRIIFKD